MSPTKLIEIAAKSSNFMESMTGVCKLWLEKCQQENTPPTWHAVAEILDLIGQKQLSKELLEVYKTGIGL